MLESFLPEFLYDHLYDYLGGYMFLALALTLFTGLPVAIAVGGIALVFGFLGIWMDILDFREFFIILPRIWGGDGSSGAIQNPVLVAIPCFIFMGTMLERSQVASDLLHILQVLLRRVPGGLALSVTVMGTILAATTGIIGASVVMMTLLALPTMLKRGYHTPLATGTLAASATLGILIPPSIMLVLMANLLAVSVGNLFVGAIFPGLVLSALYFAYILTVSSIWPEMAPPLDDEAIKLKPSDQKRMWTYGAIVAVLIGGAIILNNSPSGEAVNWSLIAFFGIFFLSMFMGKAEGDSLFGAVLKGFIPPIFLDRDGSGFDLRRLGDAHRSRRRWSLRRHDPGPCQRYADVQSAEGCLRTHGPDDGDDLLHLSGRDNLLLHLPRPLWRRPYPRLHRLARFPRLGVAVFVDGGDLPPRFLLRLHRDHLDHPAGVRPGYQRNRPWLRRPSRR